MKASTQRGGSCLSVNYSKGGSHAFECGSKVTNLSQRLAEFCSDCPAR